MKTTTVRSNTYSQSAQTIERIAAVDTRQFSAQVDLQSDIALTGNLERAAGARWQQDQDCGPYVAPALGVRHKAALAGLW